MTLTEWIEEVQKIVPQCSYVDCQAEVREFKSRGKAVTYRVYYSSEAWPGVRNTDAYPNPETTLEEIRFKLADGVFRTADIELTSQQKEN